MSAIAEVDYDVRVIRRTRLIYTRMRWYHVNQLVMNLLQQDHKTGDLTVSFHQGGVTGVRWEEGERENSP